jgi:O-antigen/teichoic acid export membrane protein
MSIVRSLLGYAPAVVLPRIVSLVLVLILTRLISKEEYGHYVLVVTLGEAIDGIVSTWVRIALARFASASDGAFGREVKRSTAVYLASLVPAIAIAVAIGVYSRPERAVEFVAALLIYLVASGLMRLPSSIMSVQADRNGIVVMEAGKAVGVLVFGVAAAFVSGSFFTQTLVYGLVTGAVGVWGLRRCLAPLDLDVGPLVPLGDWLAYGLPLVPSAIVGAVVTSSDRVFLDHIVGAEAVALYAAGAMLARQPMDFLFSLAGVRVFPLMMEDYERGGVELATRRMAELISSVVFMTLPAAAGILLVADPLARLLLAPDYAATAELVIPLMVAAAFLSGLKTFILEQIYHMVKRNGLGAAAAVPSMLVGLLAMALLVPKYGIWGCAVAFLLQNATLFVVNFAIVQTLMSFPLPWRDILRTLGATAVMAVVLRLVEPLLVPLPVGAHLGIAVALGILSYVAAVLVLRPSPVEDLLPARFRRARD